ncbi:class I SAM-dependent methyltransferase [Psychrobacillus sp. FJAT-51614]|uniref:Class I SAM-dependent methyltransferase n=1 Tax=Psychrobacillus mangrovi TaxID=3117745 RepID=A0ABU8F572_9BACI
MNKRVEETYNQLVNDYEHNVDIKSLFNTEYERPAMMNLLPSDLSNNKVLDAGCAAGWYTIQLVHLGADVTGTDLSPKMVDATRRRVGENAKVLCLDLGEKLPFENETFDWIISSLVLHYIKDWNSTFKEFRRILKPGGKLLFSVHHPFMDFKLSENGDYFSNEFIIDQWEREGKMIEVPFYRRPLQMILNDTLAHFSIEQLIEPQPTENFKMREPEKYERLMKNPHFMIVKGKKIENTWD